MPKLTRRPTLNRLLAAALGLLLAGCVTHEPPNLETAKAAVRRYHDSGAYERDLAAVAAEAQAWIEARAARRAPGERLVVVLDIDETALSNWPYLKSHDFGWDDPSWSAWIAAGEAPALAPVRTVFLAARRAGVEVVFLTGREQPRDRPGTEKNLRDAGLGDYAMLIMATSGGLKLTNAQRKTGARAALEQEGRTVIANLGDQESDLAGGHAERGFKLPDPFYRTE